MGGVSARRVTRTTRSTSAASSSLSPFFGEAFSPASLRASETPFPSALSAMASARARSDAVIASRLLNHATDPPPSAKTCGIHSDASASPRSLDLDRALCSAFATYACFHLCFALRLSSAEARRSSGVNTPASARSSARSSETRSSERSSRSNLYDAAARASACSSVKSNASSYMSLNALFAVDTSFTGRRLDFAFASLSAIAFAMSAPRLVSAATESRYPTSLEPDASYVSASSYVSRRGDVGPGGTSRGGIPRPGATAEAISAASLVIYDPRDDLHRRAESSAPSQMPDARSKRCRHNQENKYVVVSPRASASI